jgi:hypothetical protein
VILCHVAVARRFSDPVHNVVGRRQILNIREHADLAKNGLLRDVKPHFVTNLGRLGVVFCVAEYSEQDNELDAHHGAKYQVGQVAKLPDHHGHRASLANSLGGSSWRNERSLAKADRDDNKRLYSRRLTKQKSVKTPAYISFLK